MTPNQFRQRVVFIAVALCALAASPANGQVANRAGVEIASIDSNTRWGFRALSPVTVSSPIIRLRDVALPLDPNMAGWQRLQSAAVGLVPLDGHPMTIERNRLTSVIRAAEATPQAIDWVGPTKIVVEYDPNATPRHVAHAGYANADGNRGVIRQVSHGTTSAPAAPRLSAGEARRVVLWVERAIASFVPDLQQDYDVEIEPTQAGLVNLKSLAVVTNVEILDPIAEGSVNCRVTARGVSGPIEAEFQLTLAAHPSVIVPRNGLQRGHRIHANDLEAMQIHRDEMKPDYVTDATEVIGMEVRSSLSANRPILRDRLGTPILIHRGDLVEVQVVGGGITVSTNAKALAEGSASDLIEVETLKPRKRLVGRVVSSGLVEIVTRAPNVRR